VIQKCTEALSLALLSKTLVTAMLREVAQREGSDKNHQPWTAATQPKATPSQRTCVGRKQEVFAVSARAISSMEVHISVRAAAREGADYVKGTREG